MVPLLLVGIHLCQEEMTTHHHVMITIVSKTGKLHKSIIEYLHLYLGGPHNPCSIAILAGTTWAQETAGTMDLHHVIIHTVTIHPSPVPEMIMVQCHEAMGIKCFFSTYLFVRHWTLKVTPPPPVCSDRDSYGGGREPRGYMERASGGSYRDPYDGYGKIPNFSVLEKSLRMYPNSAVCSWNKMASCQSK